MKTSPYEILGIEESASPDEIRQAYLKMAKMYHPDKVAGLGPELVALAELKTKQINAAYRALQSGDGHVTVETQSDPSMRDDLFEDALTVVTDMGRASTSVLQRRLSIGYQRAAKILELMERAGFIGPVDGAKPRKVLQAAYQFRERLGKRIVVED